MREKGGTGLGLAISKKIIEQHMRIIDFVTAKSVGTTFFFVLSELIAGDENVKLEKPIPVIVNKAS